eukprot:scaffold9266_cov112-Skeletonema_marinoi.AAC.3
MLLMWIQLRCDGIEFFGGSLYKRCCSMILTSGDAEIARLWACLLVQYIHSEALEAEIVRFFALSKGPTFTTEGNKHARDSQECGIQAGL